MVLDYCSHSLSVLAEIVWTIAASEAPKKFAFLPFTSLSKLTSSNCLFCMTDSHQSPNIQFTVIWNHISEAGIVKCLKWFIDYQNRSPLSCCGLSSRFDSTKPQEQKHKQICSKVSYYCWHAWPTFLLFHNSFLTLITSKAIRLLIISYY